MKTEFETLKKAIDEQNKALAELEAGPRLDDEGAILRAVFSDTSNASP